MTDSEKSTATHTDLNTGLEFRGIGPFRGGRVVAVAGHPRDPMTFYFGACAGGVWRTMDGGTFWENISDGFFRTAAVGAIAVSDSDPNVIYVGTGEHTIRSDVSHGDGVYRSTDAGKTWTNVGLAETRHISKIRIHPQDSNIVYVAALGHAWGPNPERGLFRSIDGGAHWDRILFGSDRAGAIDLSMDPTNPRILYCALWEAQRTPYSMWSGGPGSALYRSTDGGDTWIDITRNQGLPKGMLGKIGVAASPAKAGRVWALIEAEDGALFRSDDGGDTWLQVSDNPDLRRRAWYYMHVFADPRDEETVWVLNLGAWRSVDGGATFSGVPTPHGDNHDLWIDPQNPQRMIEGNDGGACVSFNGGLAWTSILNQPTAQFYHVTADSRFPYRLYGSQQDNTAISIPSQSVYGAITQLEWFTPGGGESGYIAVRPDDPEIQYAGDHRGRITRHDRRTGQQRIIDVWPTVMGMYEGAEVQRYRFQWTFPLFVSPHDPHVLYAAGNHLFRSADEGEHWEAISPDLSRNDPSTIGPSGGTITRDNTSAEFYATIFSAVESPHEVGVFWVGTDDGLVHLSRDGGQSWTDITPPDLHTPQGEWALISILEVSPHEPAAAYVAATRYKLDDTRPYLYKTTDYGQTWTDITDGIPDGDFTRVIREDPAQRGLLYAGTETGLHISVDDGAHWETFQANLPVCPIYDLIVHEDDLVIGTHGRGFWILDDLTPIRALAADRVGQTRLLPLRATVRMKVYEGFGGGEGPGANYRMAGPMTYAFRQVEQPNGTKESVPLDAGKNRANGVLITYELAGEPEESIRLVILDADNHEIRRFSSKPVDPKNVSSIAEPTAAEATSVSGQEGAEGASVEDDPAADEAAQEPYLPTQPGLNRFVWNFRAANATRIPGDKFSELASAGPAVPPGRYTARLEVGERIVSQHVDIVPDPRLSVTQEEFVAQYDLAIRIRDAMSRVHDTVLQARDLRVQLESWETRLKRERAQEIRATARGLIDRLTTIEEACMNTKSASRMVYPPPNVPTRLNQRLAFLSGAVGSADARPTQQEYGVFEELAGLVQEQCDLIHALITQDLPPFNKAVKRLNLPPIAPPSQPGDIPSTG